MPVLLNDEKHGIRHRGEAEVEAVNHALAEVLRARREHHAHARPVDEPDADVSAVADLRLVQPDRAVEADEPDVEPLLRLAAEVLEAPGQQDDEAVARVGSLADEARVRPRLARLHIAHHETAAVPGALARGIAGEVQEIVRDAVEDIEDRRAAAVDLEEKPVAVPEERVESRPCARTAKGRSRPPSGPCLCPC